jgi:hypothetical protein
MANTHTVHDTEFPNFDKPLPEDRSNPSLDFEISIEEQSNLGSFALKIVEALPPETAETANSSFLLNAVAQLQEIGYMDRPSTQGRSLKQANVTIGNDYFSDLYAVSPDHKSSTDSAIAAQLLSLFAGCTAHQSREIIPVAASGIDQAPALTETKRSNSTLSRLADESIDRFIELRGGYSLEVERELMSYMNRLARLEKGVYASRNILINLAVSSGMDEDNARTNMRSSSQRSQNLSNAVRYGLPKLRRHHHSSRSSQPQLEVIQAGPRPNYAGLPELFG